MRCSPRRRPPLLLLPGLAAAAVLLHAAAAQPPAAADSAGAAADGSGWLAGKLGQLGYGSSYNADQGACSYGSLPPSTWPNGALAAVDPLASPFAGGVQQGCGVCIEVQCTDAVACAGSGAATLVALVADHCVGCGAVAVYLAPAAYAQLVTGSLGEVNGRFRRVNCKPPGPLTVHVDEYRATEGGWMRLALQQVAGSGDIASVSLAPSSSPEGWKEMWNTFGAAWELSALPAPPFDLKAADATGQEVVMRGAVQQAGAAGDFPTSAQFQPSPALATAAGGAAPRTPAAAPQPAPAAEPSTPQQQPAAAPAPEAAPSGGAVQLVSPGAAASPGLVVPPEARAPQPGAPSPAGLALPSPAGAAPEVLDTRPPRPPGVGPSVTPAPVVFFRNPGVPTLPPLPPAAGPATTAQLASPATADGSCRSIGEVLGQVPEASNWTQLLTRVGLSRLLQDKRAQATLLVPVNSALGAAVDARPLRNETTLSQLLLNAPELESPLVGYHVLPALWPTATLQPGARVNTSDTVDKVNRLQLTALGPDSLQGIGSSARILQGDLAACGPSVIHLIDQVLLPFTFDQAAIDAISGTAAPLAQPLTPVAPDGQSRPNGSAP